MKVRQFLILLAVLMVSACSFRDPLLALGEDWTYTFDDGGISFATLDSLCSWVSTNVVYATDLDQWGYSEYWASPEQTFDARRGDCEDKAILFMYLAHAENLALDPEMAALRMSATLGHAVVRIGDSVYDPTYGTSGPWSSVGQPVMFVLNYGETIYVATHDHDARRSLRAAMPLGFTIH